MRNTPRARADRLRRRLSGHAWCTCARFAIAAIAVASAIVLTSASAGLAELDAAPDVAAVARAEASARDCTTTFCRARRADPLATSATFAVVVLAAAWAARRRSGPAR